MSWHAIRVSGKVMKGKIIQFAIIYEDDEILYETDLHPALIGASDRVLGIPKDHFLQRLRDTFGAQVKILSSTDERFPYVVDIRKRCNIPNRYILQDFSILEACSGIKRLEITSNIDIVSLDGISSLINLEDLFIGPNCRLSNLHGLEFCHSLRVLAIPTNDVSDLSPVQDHPLRILDISSNPINTLAGMNLTYLKMLVIDQDQCQLFKNVHMPALRKMIITDVTDEDRFNKMTARFGGIVERR